MRNSTYKISMFLKEKLENIIKIIINNGFMVNLIILILNIVSYFIILFIIKKNTYFLRYKNELC